MNQQEIDNRINQEFENFINHKDFPQSMLAVAIKIGGYLKSDKQGLEAEMTWFSMVGIDLLDGKVHTLTIEEKTSFMSMHQSFIKNL